MPVEIMWDTEEQLAIRIDQSGTWTWDEVYVAHDEALRMMAEVNRKVLLIYDVTHSVTVPDSALTHFKALARKMSDHVSATALVGGNAFMGQLFNMFNRLAGDWAKHHHFLATLDEARALARTLSNTQA